MLNKYKIKSLEPKLIHRKCLRQQNKSNKFLENFCQQQKKKIQKTNQKK